MSEKRKIIDEFNTLLNEDVRQCIRQDINFTELENYDKILILQSAPKSILDELIFKVYHTNPKVELIIWGKSICEDLQRVFQDKNICLISHNKRFEIDDLETLRNIELTHKPDMVLFFNNFVHSLDFANVERLMERFEGKIPIYSYSYVQGELNKHERISRHIHGCILYKDMVEWFSTWT